jgi:hypothetical protein
LRNRALLYRRPLTHPIRQQAGLGDHDPVVDTETASSVRHEFSFSS